MQTIGQRIEQARAKRDVSIERIAAECDVSVGTVRNWIGDSQSPRMEHAPDLCRVLGVSVSWLVFGKERAA